MNCQKCGADFPDGSPRCPKCGMPAVKPQAGGGAKKTLFFSGGAAGLPGVSPPGAPASRP